MLKICLSKSEWELHETATEKDVHTLNQAANRAVLDVLTEMQAEGVSIDVAVSEAVERARTKFLALADVGACDSEPLWLLDREVRSQFYFKGD